MLYEQIDELIANARKSGDKTLLKVLQLIKSDFMKYKTSSKDAKLTEESEAKILLKMSQAWKEEYHNLLTAGRDTSIIIDEIDTLMDFVPEIPTEEQIKTYTIDAIAEYNHDNLSMKDMKTIMNMVKEREPLADGGIIARVFKEYLK